MIHHITRATRHLIFWGLIAIALILTAIRFTLSVIDIYKEDLEMIISREIAAPVKIGHLGAGMRGFRPELLLKNVRVLGKGSAKAPIVVREIRLSMDLLQSYGQQQLLASSRITLVGTRATVIRQVDGRISVEGLGASDSEPPLWILQTAQFELLQSQLTWRDERRAATSPQATDGLVFNKVNVVLKSDQDGQRHALKLLLTLPEHYGKAIRGVMQLRGNFLAAEGVTGLIYLEGQDLHLANLLAEQALPLDLSVKAGQGDIQLWSYWQRSELQAITGNTLLRQIVLQRPLQAPLAVKQFQQRFNWRKLDSGWQWQADSLTLNTTTREGESVAIGREPMRADQFQLTNAKILLQGSNTGPNTLRRVELQIPQLDLPLITQLSQFFDAPLPVPALQGQLKQFSLALTPAAQEFAVQGTLDKVSLPANKDFPGISNLSAQLQGNQQQGAIELDSQNTALDLPHIFANPLPLNALHAHFDWQQDAEGWVLNSPNIALAVPDLQADSRLQLKVNRQTHAVWMDLQAAFKGSSDIKSFGRYWPTGLMGKEAVDWLNQAFAKGQVKPQGLLFSGALADFPFQHKQGVFELILDFKDIDLQYAADWDPVQAIDAQVLFYNEGMQIAAERASVRGAALQQFDLSLPSFQSSPYITVNVKGAGDIMQTLGYLQHSPVKNSVEQLLQIITPQGLAPINLSIQVPLSDQAALKIKGGLQLQNVRLTVVPLTLPVSNLQGTIDFNEQGIVGGQLQAQALGDNIKVALKNNAESMQLDILGHADIVDIQQPFSAPLWQYAQGDSDYELNVNLPNDNSTATLSLKSDLTGTAFSLPEPLAKRAATARPFRLQMNLGEQSLLPVNIQFDKQLQLSALLNVKEKKLSAAQLLIGTGELDALPGKGGVLTLNVERCGLDDWLALADSVTSSDTAVTPFFEHIKLRAKQALWQNQALGNLSLQWHHEYPSWKMELDSPLVKGRIRSASDPALDKPTLLDLDYVNVSALTQLNTTAPQKPEHKRLPLFNLTAQQVLWNGMNVGVLALETERIANGIAFKQLSLKNAQGGLNLTGSWTLNAAEQLTELTGNLVLREFGGFLSSMQISRDLKATALSAALNLHWAGGPHNVALDRLNGRVDLELKNGRILSIEPGFGRLLGFLAFEQWGRRLRLDFSDMLAEGLTFNRIYGRFDLQHGDAVTHNLVVDAVPAEVNISGIAHLAERTLDYHAKVLPKSSAALPIAGTIVDRILTYSLETITGTSQAGFLMGSEYKILGQWQNPQVIRLREKDGLLQKTWYGLTDFSWLQNKTISKNQ